jgi:hypothetical protein
MPSPAGGAPSAAFFRARRGGFAGSAKRVGVSGVPAEVSAGAVDGGAASTGAAAFFVVRLRGAFGAEASASAETASALAALVSSAVDAASLVPWPGGGTGC